MIARKLNLTCFWTKNVPNQNSFYLDDSELSFTCSFLTIYMIRYSKIKKM